MTDFVSCIDICQCLLLGFGQFAHHAYHRVGHVERGLKRAHSVPELKRWKIIIVRIDQQDQRRFRLIR